MRWIRGAIALAGLILLSATGPGEHPSQTVVFPDYPQIATNDEILRRAFSPLAGAKARAAMAPKGGPIVAAALDPARESFALWIPDHRPEKGYGLMVFTPPWDRAGVPPDWRAALDRRGVIFVSAARSGNGERIYGRRMPLALIAAASVIARYPVDRNRVYIAGFSGGSRVALRLALAFPDLFTGALLNSGSDAIGEADAPLPPRDFFELFQTRSRLTYVTGERDAPVLSHDQGSLASMQAFCVQNLWSRVMPRRGHEPADSETFEAALACLDDPPRVDAPRLTRCRSVYENELAGRLAAAERDRQAGRISAARHAADAIDRRFGGLAGKAALRRYDLFGV